MKKILLVGLLVSLVAHVCYADNATGDKSLSGSVAWNSKDSSTPVTIQNGTGVAIIIQVHVNKDGSDINLSNCGTTTHVAAGSSAICATNDADNPVSFSADSPNKPALGTYEIRQQ